MSFHAAASSHHHRRGRSLLRHAGSGIQEQPPAAPGPAPQAGHPAVGGDCERLEARLIYERDRARREGNAVLFLLEREPGEEAREIARHFCRGEPDLFCGDAAGLRAAISDDAVYKVVEIVLY